MIVSNVSVESGWVVGVLGLLPRILWEDVLCGLVWHFVCFKKIFAHLYHRIRKMFFVRYLLRAGGFERLMMVVRGLWSSGECCVVNAA